ncbi:MAG: hypothetical protein ABSC18_07225 [Verrucomicrobiota bacterium]|jgi:hypothetical protein
MDALRARFGENIGASADFQNGVVTNPERRLAVGFTLARTLKAEWKSALRTRKREMSG